MSRKETALDGRIGLEDSCPDCGHTKCSEDCNCNCDASCAEHEASILIARIERVERERDEARSRLRETARILIEETGADGPMNAEDAARKIVSMLRGARVELERLKTIAYFARILAGDPYSRGALLDLQDAVEG
jgi:hypothetical protein